MICVVCSFPKINGQCACTLGLAEVILNADGPATEKWDTVLETTALLNGRAVFYEHPELTYASLLLIVALMIAKTEMKGGDGFRLKDVSVS